MLRPLALPILAIASFLPQTIAAQGHWVDVQPAIYHPTKAPVSATEVVYSRYHSYHRRHRARKTAKRVAIGAAGGAVAGALVGGGPGAAIGAVAGGGAGAIYDAHKRHEHRR